MSGCWNALAQASSVGALSLSRLPVVCQLETDTNTSLRIFLEILPSNFTTWAPAHLEGLSDQARAAMMCANPDELQKLLTGLYLGVHSFCVQSQLAGFAAVHKLSCTLEGMLKKLMENPKAGNASTWRSTLSALELLAELSHAGKNLDFGDASARILVVDDDPVARRAISGSIQRVFGKPETADSGQTAVAMAAEKRFDLVFLDICMPGIDGFGTCIQIYQTELNQRTPVIFITNQDDPGARENAATSGGSGFLLKTVLPSQITLTALTSILRNRLDEMETASIVTVKRELAGCPA